MALRAALSTLLAATFAGLAFAQVFDEQFDHWPTDLRLRGTLVLASELDDLSVLRDAVARAADAAKPTIVAHVDAADSAASDRLAAQYRRIVAPTKSMEDAATRDNPADDANEPSPAVEVVAASDVAAGKLTPQADRGVLCWHSTPQMTTETQAAFAAAGDALRKHLDAGGTLVVVGSAAELASRHRLDAADGQPRTQDATHLAPDCVIATDYDDARDRGKLLAALALQPRSVGVGIEKNTALVLSGRTLRAIGSGTVTLLLMANERQPLRVQKLAARRSPRQPPHEYLADLTEWRRDAIDRTLPPFPPPEPRPPLVENGTLVIVGGGGMPRGLMRRFVDLAGGNDEARLVYVPCAEEDDVGQRHGTLDEWKRMGVKHATFLHTKDRRRANEDEEFFSPLRDATGIWFGGGRQWNLADSYYGTTAHRLMKDVLRRGGVIGGSSAGASIQARYLARATPIGNTRIMAPGYERGGLGFLSGVAIDQHFSQRGRQRDMTELMRRHPQLLGIGLDEATAIVVQMSTAEIVGDGKVYFYDRRQPVFPDRPDYIALGAGARFDLVERKEVDVAPDTKQAPDSKQAHDTGDVSDPSAGR